MDKFDNFINKNILCIRQVPKLPSRNGDIENNSSGYIQFDISYDNFDKYLREIKTINSKLPIHCIVYDETVVDNDNDLLLRVHFLKELNKLNIENIQFRLSESTLPIYNVMMDRINWKHDDYTFLQMTVDRKPTEIKDLKLLQARGKILLPEEKLLWVDDYTLSGLRGKVDPKVLEDTDKLKYAVRRYADALDEHYYFDRLTPVDKVYLTYHYIKDRDKLNVQFAHERTIIVDGIQRRKPSDYRWEGMPYETYIRRRGVCEGQARLMRIFLNNWDLQLDAVTISGYTKKGEPHQWVGVNINEKLCYCCTTSGGLMQPMSFRANADELYPKVYPLAYLTSDQLNKVERHVRSLRRG